MPIVEFLLSVTVICLVIAFLGFVSIIVQDPYANQGISTNIFVTILAIAFVMITAIAYWPPGTEKIQCDKLQCQLPD